MHANFLKYFMLLSLETISLKTKEINWNLQIVSVYHKRKEKKEKNLLPPVLMYTCLVIDVHVCVCVFGVCVSCPFVCTLDGLPLVLGRCRWQPTIYLQPTATTDTTDITDLSQQQQQRDSGWTRMDILRVRRWRSSGTHSWAIVLWASPTDRRAVTM